MEVIKLTGRTSDLADFLSEAMLSQKFADVALCCPGGHRFMAHRLVLSAASPYLQEVLEAHSSWVSGCEPITLILAEVGADELGALLGFVYTGRATVPRYRLDAFLRIAQVLRIRLPELYDQPEPIELSNYDDASLPATGPSAPNLPVEDLSLYDRPTSCGPRLQIRRQVANQVTASPWSQILRPHHSPKLQPIVRQRASPWIPPPKDRSTASVADLEMSVGPGMYRCHVSQVPGNLAEAQPPLNETIAEQRVPTSSMYSPVARSPQPPEPIAPAIAKPPSPGGAKPESRQIELSLPVSRLCNSLAGDKLDGDPKPRLTLQNDKASMPNDEADEEKNTPSDNEHHDSNNNNDSSSNYNYDNEDPERGAGDSRREDCLSHKCQQCEKVFVTKASLKVHLRTHSGEKPFQCSDCGKQFSQLRNYKYHRSVHEGTREFAASCPECGKYFNDRGYLSSHMKIHRNRKEYACAECGKSFNQRVAYNMHVRIHTGLKPHECEQCGKAFSRKMLLKQHLRTHSGERPYQCQVCHKAFADRSNMTLHTRLHSGLKPYQCTLCSKAFTKKHHLKTHLNYHTGSKPYSCPNCALSFSQSSNMRTHYKKCLLLGGPPPKTTTPAEPLARKSQDNNNQQLTPPSSDQESSSFIAPV